MGLWVILFHFIFLSFLHFLPEMWNILVIELKNFDESANSAKDGLSDRKGKKKHKCAGINIVMAVYSA